MTQRNEPTIGSVVTGFFGKNKGVGHTKLVDSALEAFTKAEQQMTDAITQINEEVAEEARIAREAEQRMEAAKQSAQKLTRVLERVKAFTA